MIAWPEKVQLVENKYSKWYQQLISNALVRVLPAGTYIEKHHIIPKSFGGSNCKNNLVKLTAREHYIAHALLWKFDIEKQFHIKMNHAFNAMCIMKDSALHNKPKYKINSKIFAQLKLERNILVTTDPVIQERLKRVAKELGQRPKGENFKRLTSLRFTGRTDTIGKDNPNFGNRWTDEMKAMMSQKRTGQRLSSATLQQRREKMSKKQYVCEHCGKLSKIKTNYIRWHGDHCKTLNFEPA